MTAPARGALPVPQAVEEIAGRVVPLHFGDPAAEYAALREAAALIDRSARFRTTLAGAKAAEVLTGLVTNDVLALAPGQGQYAVALNPKGKILADVRIFARAADLLVDVPPRAADGWWQLLRKFVNPRLARYEDRSAELRDLGLFGTRAHEIAAHLAGVPADELTALAPYAHRLSPDGSMLVARVPDLGVEGFDLIVPAGAADAVALRALELGATPAGLAVWRTARIEAGRPEWGLDIDDSTIPQEANFDELHAISYTKGCYTGQETVARVHFRGHVNRHLRGLRHDGDPLPRLAQLVDDAGKVVGDVRSSTRSPRLGSIALAMVRREVVPPAELRAVWEGGAARVEVIALPFPS